MVTSARSAGCSDGSSQNPKERKRRRAYHRLRTGLAFHYGKRMRFLTLTLVEGSNNDIHQCFRAFKERIRRLTPNKIRKMDPEYFTDQRMHRFFGPEEGWDKKVKFEYFAVNVSGSRQHMHILYFGSFLPQPILKKMWKEITGDSDIIDIRTTREGINNDGRLAGYVLAQYVGKQEGDIRFQMSHGWTWKGMVKDWKRAVRKYTTDVRGVKRVDFQNLLRYWADFVKSMKTKQVKLT